MLNEPKPTFPYKNLREYIKHFWYLDKDIEYPCRECSGKGRIYDPDDPPCPIEGNKLRNRIICPKCKGTKEQTREEWMEEYKEAKYEYSCKLSGWKAKRVIIKGALSKLTKIEKEALGLLNQKLYK